jgi:hypothetical protein
LTVSTKCRDFGRCLGLDLFEFFAKKLRYFELSVGNTVDVGRPTIMSGCLPITALAFHP